MLLDSIHLVYPGKNKAQGKILTVVIIRDREVFGKLKKKNTRKALISKCFFYSFSNYNRDQLWAIFDNKSKIIIY